MTKPWELLRRRHIAGQISHLRCLRCVEWVPVEQLRDHEVLCSRPPLSEETAQRLIETLGRQRWAKGAGA